MSEIKKENDELREEVLRLQLIVQQQEKGLKAVAALMDESEGVYGLHLNGDYKNSPVKTGVVPFERVGDASH